MSFRRKPLVAAIMVWALLPAGVWRTRAVTNSSAWSYRAWPTDDGLPDNSVTGLAQTAEGYLWVATYGGLMRFNGANFAAIPPPGLLKKPVRTLWLDGRGRLWLGMDSGAVICLEADMPHTCSGVDGLPAERIAAMVEDHAGDLWNIYSSTLCRIKDGRVSRFGAPEGLPAGINGWVATDARGEVWFSKAGQVGVWRDGKLFPKLTFKETSVRIYGAVSAGLWICAGSRLPTYTEGGDGRQ